MADRLRTPGVYVAEVPNGARAIVGVPTSITAFVGRARRGPVDEPVTLTSVAEFDRVFGGVWAESALGQHVADYFRQGGGTAVVVRVHATTAGDTATITLGTNPDQLTLRAASPGAWGSGLTAMIARVTAEPGDAPLYRLTIVDSISGQREVYDRVSTDPTDGRSIDHVLEQQSTLVRVSGNLPPGAVVGPGDSQTQPAAPANDGSPITKDEIANPTLSTTENGLYALEKADLVNLIVVPPYTTAGDIDPEVRTAVVEYAEKRRAIFVMDPPASWTSVGAAHDGADDPSFTRSSNAAVYFPRVCQPDPNDGGLVARVAASGSVAGVIAATDAARGVWKAPAGLEAKLTGVTGLDTSLRDSDIGQLSRVGTNCIRASPGLGHVVWGARTRASADGLSSEWKYLPVRRLALFLEESLDRGLQWAVFEPNGEQLWSQIRLTVDAFLNNLFRQGAFQGTSADEAYFVTCDAGTTTSTDRTRGVVNIYVGFAPLKPAEFVVLRLQQTTGRTMLQEV